MSAPPRMVTNKSIHRDEIPWCGKSSTINNYLEDESREMAYVPHWSSNTIFGIVIDRVLNQREWFEEKKEAKMKQNCTNRIEFQLEVGGDQIVTQGKECPDQENKLHSRRLEAKSESAVWAVKELGILRQ